jgi:hypothetical protein
MTVYIDYLRNKKIGGPFDLRPTGVQQAMCLALVPESNVPGITGKTIICSSWDSCFCVVNVLYVMNVSDTSDVHSFN